MQAAQERGLGRGDPAVGQRLAHGDARGVGQADADGKIEWTVSVDATINRAHQHATNTTRPEQDTGGTSNK